MVRCCRSSSRSAGEDSCGCALGTSIGTTGLRLAKLARGGVSERPKERASKAREGQPSEGSNPSATAKGKCRLASVRRHLWFLQRSCTR